MKKLTQNIKAKSVYGKPVPGNRPVRSLCKPRHMRIWNQHGGTGLRIRLHGCQAIYGPNC